MTSFRIATFLTLSTEFTAHCRDELIQSSVKSRYTTPAFLADLSKVAFSVNRLRSTKLKSTILWQLYRYSVPPVTAALISRSRRPKRGPSPTSWISLRQNQPNYHPQDNTASKGRQAKIKLIDSDVNHQAIVIPDTYQR